MLSPRESKTMAVKPDTKTAAFPIDTTAYQPLALDPAAKELSPAQREQLERNIGIVRDTIIFFTAIAGIKGMAGHTGGPYSIVPEILIADGFIRGAGKRCYPVLFDEAGHRVAIQYAMLAFNGRMPFEKLLHYREAGHGLWGHPERDPKLGMEFSSGRLGHIWPFVNGVARANPDKAVFVFGSDGSQQEGNDAEAARLAVAQNFNVKVIIDDNNVTIAGHPRDYLPGYHVDATLRGHGLTVLEGYGEELDDLYGRMQEALATEGPVAVVNKRPMAPGVPGIEASIKGHDVIAGEHAIAYLRAREQNDAVEFLEQVEKPTSSVTYLGSTKECASNRASFGDVVNEILDELPQIDRAKRVFVIDSDLEGSTGLKAIGEKHPEVYVRGGVMERGNLSAAAGFGFDEGKQGVFSTFSAFLEMVVSELTMARLNDANLLCHFSHAGVDEIADNTCHYGINIFLAHSGLPHNDATRLYFPADNAQFHAAVKRVFFDKGIRFVFSTRSKVPFILKENGDRFYGDDYTFEPGRDEIIREGNAGYLVSYGEMLYRALDAVDRARAEGLDVGLINKPTLNVIDEQALERAGNSPFVLVVEGQNINTGLGARYGAWLLERGLTPKYAAMGVTKPGNGGIPEHVPYQGLAPSDILARIKKL